jgi:galactonate dehydratase
VVKSSLVTENGYWLPSNEPGLGIEVDEERAKEHPFQQEVMHSLSIRAPDNAILDW